MRTTIAVKNPPTDTGACGSSLGYNRHKQRKQHACDPCTAAERTHRQQLRMRHAISTVPAGAPMPSVFGRYAATPTMHRPVLVDGQCLACWGFPDDVRHPVAEAGPWQVFGR